MSPKGLKAFHRITSTATTIESQEQVEICTEGSPLLALNASLKGVSSPAAQLHSGHIGVHSSHLSAYDVEATKLILPTHSRDSVIDLNFPACDIGVPVTLSAKSNGLHGEERIVFENAANMVQYYKWFVNPIVKPAENDTLLESY
ncbi:hypothetical protein HOY80DRAFT_1006109 [Tuber brumale]|nr:hypothetical protein HOY80DRAFT_1006109 [Tuber brumale]